MHNQLSAVKKKKYVLSWSFYNNITDEKTIIIVPETQKETIHSAQGNDVYCEEVPKLIILVVASQHDGATELEKFQWQKPLLEKKTQKKHQVQPRHRSS